MENNNQKQSQESLDELRDLDSDNFLATILVRRFFDKTGYKSLVFILTCPACPEQYDVQSVPDGTQLGYIRFRMGKFKVVCPDVGGEVILQKLFPEPFQGCFYSEQERQDSLQEAAEAIWKYYERKDK